MKYTTQRRSERIEAKRVAAEKSMKAAIEAEEKDSMQAALDAAAKYMMYCHRCYADAHKMRKRGINYFQLRRGYNAAWRLMNEVHQLRAEGRTKYMHTPIFTEPKFYSPKPFADEPAPGGKPEQVATVSGGPVSVKQEPVTELSDDPPAVCPEIRPGRSSFFCIQQ